MCDAAISIRYLVYFSVQSSKLLLCNLQIKVLFCFFFFDHMHLQEKKSKDEVILKHTDSSRDNVLE